MKVPAAMLRRVEALEAKAEPREADRRGRLRFMTDAELDEFMSILEEHTPRCPSCGGGLVSCHHARPDVTWSDLGPGPGRRAEEMYRLAAARRRAAAEGRLAELPDDVRRHLEDDQEMRAP